MSNQNTSPARFIAGFTQDRDFQPLGNLGIPNPFFYEVDEDDFLPYLSSAYTVSATGGTVAAQAGAGGLVQFYTGTVANNFASIQRPVASFVLPSNVRSAYLTRVNLSAITGPAFIAGLCANTTTPFTGTPDGIYFHIAATTGVVNLLVVISGAVVGTFNVSSVFTLAAGSTFDLGWQWNPHTRQLSIFAGTNLVGSVLDQNTTSVGLVGHLALSALPTAALSPSLALQTTTTTAYTLLADFQLAAVER